MKNSLKGMFGSLLIAGLLTLSTGFNEAKAQFLTVHNLTTCDINFEGKASTTCSATCITPFTFLASAGTITVPAPCVWTPFSSVGT